MGRKRKYFTEEERKAAMREAVKRHYQNNREKKLEYQIAYNAEHKEDIAKYQTVYNTEHKEDIAKYQAEYYQTKKGKAKHLFNTYKSSDKKYNRGECTLTAEWIVENIFSQPCHYCGRTDWRKMGCDRIDNSLPHTPDNVVPCCYHCNCKKHTTPYDEFIKMTGKVEHGEAAIE